MKRVYVRACCSDDVNRVSRGSVTVRHCIVVPTSAMAQLTCQCVHGDGGQRLD